MAVQYGMAQGLRAQLKGPYGSVSIRLTELTLYQDQWKGAVSPYAQQVAVPGITAGGKVDLQPRTDQLGEPLGTVFLAENEEGLVTVWAVGEKPRQDLSFQATVMEVTR